MTMPADYRRRLTPTQHFEDTPRAKNQVLESVRTRVGHLFPLGRYCGTMSHAIYKQSVPVHLQVSYDDEQTKSDGSQQ